MTSWGPGYSHQVVKRDIAPVVPPLPSVSLLPVARLQLRQAQDLLHTNH